MVLLMLFIIVGILSSPQYGFVDVFIIVGILSSPQQKVLIFSLSTIYHYLAIRPFRKDNHHVSHKVLIELNQGPFSRAICSP